MKFEIRHIHLAHKFADHILKQAMREDPRTAIIGLAMVTMLAARECGVNRRQLFDLLTRLDTAPPEATDAAVSSLILPA